jgi:hypothetical protein
MNLQLEIPVIKTIAQRKDGAKSYTKKILATCQKIIPPYSLIYLIKILYKTILPLYSYLTFLK